MWCLSTINMKSKDSKHPKLYLKILNQNKELITVEYKDNNFGLDGERIVKVEQIILDKEYQNYSKDIEILNKLNKQEKVKLNHYIKVQNKVLEYHKKNKNYDSVDTVIESIKIMELFKKEFVIHDES